LKGNRVEIKEKILKIFNGSEIMNVDISDEACKSFGFKHRDRFVVSNKSAIHGTVLGVDVGAKEANARLWGYEDSRPSVAIVLGRRSSGDLTKKDAGMLHEPNLCTHEMFDILVRRFKPPVYKLFERDLNLFQIGFTNELDFYLRLSVWEWHAHTVPAMISNPSVQGKTLEEVAKNLLSYPYFMFPLRSCDEHCPMNSRFWRS
jgi:hypothetical protein